MYTNRFLIVLGILSLLLVAMVISFPLSNTPTSAEDARTADAARWTAMGESYEKLESQLQRSQAADAARWEAMGEYYLNQAADDATVTAMMDSATRSYIAQAEAVACGVEATYGLNLDAATRSYIAWGSALQAKNEIGALCR